MRTLVVFLVLVGQAFGGTRTTKPPVGTSIDGTNGIASGLVHLWAMQEGTGTATSDIIGANAMTINSGATWSTGADGVSKALSFDGTTNASVTSNSTFALNTSNANVLSMCALVNTAGTVRSNIFGANNTVGDIVFEGVSSNGNQSFAAAINGTFIAQVASGSYTASTWTLLCYTRNGTGAGSNHLYAAAVNKTLTIDATNSYLNTATTQILGARTATTQNWTGKIEWVAYWNRVLTPTEITSINSSTIYQVFANASSTRHRVIGGAE
jgi:hypothetical protein